MSKEIPDPLGMCPIWFSTCLSSASPFYQCWSLSLPQGASGAFAHHRKRLQQRGKDLAAQKRFARAFHGHAATYHSVDAAYFSLQRVVTYTLHDTTSGV